MARGQKTGGREKGTPNKATAARQQEVAESGLTPLAFLLNLMRDDEEALEKRLDAAKAAAPFVHPKLSAITAEVTGAEGGPLQVQKIERVIVRPSDTDG